MKPYIVALLVAKAETKLYINMEAKAKESKKQLFAYSMNFNNLK